MSMQVGYQKQIIFGLLLLCICFIVIESISQILWFEHNKSCKLQTFYYDGYARELIEKLCNDYKSIKYLDSSIRTNYPNQSGYTYSINEFGFRGKSFDFNKSDNEYRIIMVGGSTTFGLGSTNDDETIPAHLESMLNQKFEQKIHVINAGVIAANSKSEVFYIENELIEFSPNLIVVFDGYNDSFEIDLTDASEDQNYSGNTNKNAIEKIIKKYFNWLASPKIFYQFTHDYFQSQSLTNELKTENTKKWLERWNHICKLSKEHDFELLITVQPMIGTDNRTLSDVEREIIKSNVQFEKTLEFLNDLGNNINSLSCPHADLRDTFNDYDDQIFFSLVHTGDKQNKIIANKIYEKILPIISNDLKEREQL